MCIILLRSAGERVGVGCKNDDVLQLRADWLVYENMFAVTLRSTGKRNGVGCKNGCAAPEGRLASFIG